MQHRTDQKSRRTVLSALGSAGAVALAGCSRRTSNSESKPLDGMTLTVGVLVSMHSVGDAIVGGAEVAAERINRDGGIAGAEIELVTEEISPGSGFGSPKERHEHLCSERGCDLTIGLAREGPVLDALTSIERQEVVHMTTGAHTAAAGEHVAEEYDTLKYHFRAGVPDGAAHGAALAEFVAAGNHDWERAAVILPENIASWANRHEEAFLEAVPDRLSIPFSLRLPLSYNPHEIFDEIEAEECDVCFAPWAPTPLSESWAEQQRQFAFGGSNLFCGSAALACTPVDRRFPSAFTLNSLPSTEEVSNQGARFYENYRDHTGAQPTTEGTMTYDALLMYRKAVESIVGPDDSEFPDQEQIVEALEEITFTDGVVYPEFEFTGPDADRVHEPVWESMADTGVPLIQQWQSDGEGGGRREVIAPEPHQTAAYQPPPWLNGE